MAETNLKIRHLPLVSRTERITPKIARQWLDDQHVRQRPVAQARVHAYAADMKAGRWQQTGESIKFDNDGQLLDGQHRLRAIIEAGATIEVMVVRGLPRESFFAIDTGKTRGGGDALAIDGTDTGISKIVATAASMSIAYRRGAQPVSSQHRPTNREVVEFVRSHPDIVEAVRFVHANAAKGAPMSEAQLSWACYECRKLEDTEADLFILDLIQGAALHSDDPVLQLREMLLANRASRRKMETAMLLAAVVKAWNRRRKSQKARKGSNVLTRKDWQQFPKFE